MATATTVRLHSLAFSDLRTYMVAALFIIGNIALPQLVHLIPRGGLIWLPIYFFTLVGAYKYGWKVGLLTAIASPLVNSALFGMPASAAVPAILLKSVLLAVIAGVAASRFRKVTLPLLLGVVLGYQVLGTLGEWMMKGSLMAALQDFRLGLPGMLVQVIGGWALLRWSMLSPTRQG